ncbi:MAG: sulfatase-like hydrolase/transferase [Myxococcota bacterium]
MKWANAWYAALAIGAAAGMCTALADFGATWLWVPVPGDRAWLLARLLATQVPLGACIVVLALALQRGWNRALRKSSVPASRALQLKPLAGALVASPLWFWVGRALFSGGFASTLPGAPALGLLVGGLLTAMSYAAIAGVGRLYIYAQGAQVVVVRVIAAAFFLIFFAATKADQHLYPNLYAYLHGVLAIAAFVAAALGITFASIGGRAEHFLRTRSSRFRAVSVVTLIGAAALHFATVGSNQNVRVRLFDVRAATSRSIMLALSPALDQDAAGPTEEAIARARQLRQARRAGGAAGLPTWPGAHVLLVTIDALRPDHLGLHGYPRPTSPTLDRLAEHAVVFERAYAQAPHSSYSLTSLMTSEYTHEVVELGNELPMDTLPRSLEAAGYQTSAFYTRGIFHTEGERLAAYRDEAFGFQRHEHRDNDAEAKTDEVLSEAERLVGEGEPPTFFWVHYFDAHEPYRRTDFGTADIDRYDSEIRHVDEELGRLIAGMEARLRRELVVLVTSDHGEEFRDHGGVYHGSTLYDEQIRVPLLISAPDLEPVRVETPVEVVDLAPTILGMAELPVPPSMRGDDLRPLFEEADRESVGPAFSAVAYKRAVVDWPYKLIADLRFNLFQLYDLRSDPKERDNLANQEAETLERLKGEIYAWLDALRSPPHAPQIADPELRALDQGRLGDLRALEPLEALLLRASAPEERRLEAARILGRLGSRNARATLFAAMTESEDLVSAEAAIALGRLYDERAAEPLRSLMYAEDPDLRARAAVSLGRLRDPAAVPGLIDALWVAPTKFEREEAVRWLGRIRDPRAVESLLSLLPEFRIRLLAALALGNIGDPRAFPPLFAMLEWETHGNIRNNVVRALGQLGDDRAAPRLVALAAEEPEMSNAGESLVRLRAIESGLIGGVDFSHASDASGLGECEIGPVHHDWNYRQRTWCESTAADVRIPLRVSERVRAAQGTVVLLRLKRVDSGRPTSFDLSIGEHPAQRHPVDGEWTELRFDVAPDALRNPASEATLRLPEGVRVRLDHLLLVPRGSVAQPAPRSAAPADDPSQG